MGMSKPLAVWECAQFRAFTDLHNTLAMPHRRWDALTPSSCPAVHFFFFATKMLFESRENTYCAFIRQEVSKFREQSLRKSYSIKCICGLYTRNSSRQQKRVAEGCGQCRAEQRWLYIAVSGSETQGLWRLCPFFLFVSSFSWSCLFWGLNPGHYAREADTVLLCCVVASAGFCFWKQDLAVSS